MLEMIIKYSCKYDRAYGLGAENPFWIRKKKGRLVLELTGTLTA